MKNDKLKKYEKSSVCVVKKGTLSALDSDVYNLLKRSVITEKTTFVSEMGKIVFDVPVKATKKEIAEAVSAIYGIGVVSVNTLIRKGKVKRFKGVSGVRSDIKRAYVTLEKGANIDVFAGIK